MVLACVDVNYTDETAVAGCVLFLEWTDAVSVARLTEVGPSTEPYVPGSFYLRELPPLLRVLSRVKEPLEAIVVDGYVWLGDEPGLGARLFAALGERVPVIGVAKSRWGGATRHVDVAPERREVSITRGGSGRPLYVTASGIEVERAAALVSHMHGEHRIPTLLKDVDALVRAQR